MAPLRNTAPDDPPSAWAPAPVRPPQSDRPAPVIALAAVFVLSLVLVAVRSPDGVVASADPGFEPVPLPLLLVPAAACIALTLLLPRGAGRAAVAVRRPRSVRAETSGLLALAVGFTLAVPILPRPEDYVLLKAAMFMLIPSVVLGEILRRRGASVEIERPDIPAWVPLLPALVLGVTATVGPFSPGPPATWPPLAMLLIGASATAVTAGLGEELLYRRFLQTRLEALCGPWTALLAVSLLFGLMHVFTHGAGPLWASAAQAIALQGVTGVALGLLWRRWRRLWPCVLAHVLLNGLTVLLHLVGLTG